MTSLQKKPGVAFWATLVVLVVLVAYPLSFGPACWLSDRGNFDFYSIRPFYHSLRRQIWHCPRAIIQALCWWGNLGCESPMVAESHLLDVEAN
jgi:hypothetical protein